MKRISPRPSKKILFYLNRLSIFITGDPLPTIKELVLYFFVSFVFCFLFICFVFIEEEDNEI